MSYINFKEHKMSKLQGGSRPAIFITGAASGIGFACAELFALHGWYVGLYDINKDEVDKAVSSIRSENLITGWLDVTSPISWDSALAEFWEKSHQRLDILLNNAGILFAGDFRTVDLSNHHSMLTVNIHGVVNGCHAAFDYLKLTPHSQVINMSSATAIYGQPELVTYSASKFAVRGLTEGLDIEWRKHGIRVKDIWPSFVKTQMFNKFKNIQSTKSLGVHLTANDVAKVVWKCATSNSFLSKTHWEVGFQTKLLHLATSISPNVLTKWVVQKITS